MEMHITSKDLSNMDKRMKKDYEGIIKEIVVFKTLLLLKGADVDLLGEIDATTLLKSTRASFLFREG